MGATATCPNCGGPLSTEGWQGLCPRCVVVVSLGLPAREPAAEAASSSREQAPSEVALPCQFAGYELLQVIGAGGMGVVYRAWQEGLHRAVAVKLMRDGRLVRSLLALARFKREAAAIGSLHHPNIVAIHEFGEHAGQPYFSMDLVEGASLAELAAQGPLSPSRAACYAKTIAEAVAYAHGHGILHRDLKPANVLIDEHDQPRILDFGLAKRLYDETDLTCTGSLLGSPSFMPPEQLASRQGANHPSSDIYSIGAILYNILTGRAPFLAADMESTLLQVLDAEPVSPRLLNPAVPIDLESVCLKCLEKDPARRYASAQLLADDLSRFLRGEPTLARPLSRAATLWRWCKRKPALAGLIGFSALLLAALVSVTGVANVRLAQKEWVVRERSYVADMHLVAQALASDSFSRARELLERWRPGWAAPNHHSFFRSLLQNSQSDLRGWEWRYFWNQCQGGQAFTLGSHPGSVSSLVFSPDGSRLASGSFDGTLKLWDIASRRQLGGTHHAGCINAILFSADNSHLISGGDDRAVRFWSGRDLTPSGKALALSNNVVALALESSATQLLIATLDSLIACELPSGRQIGQWPLPCWQQAAFSPDHTLLALGQPNGSVWLWSRLSQTNSATLTGHSEFVLPVAFSPDGSLLASGSFDFSAGLWNSRSHEQIAKLVGHKASVSALAFSPDNRTLATGSYDQTIRLWRTSDGQLLDGTRAHHSSVWSLAFSRDGHWLASGGKDGTIKFWNFDSIGQSSNSFVIPPELTHGPISRDGQRMLTMDSARHWTVWDLEKIPTPHRLPPKLTHLEFASLAIDDYALIAKDEAGRVEVRDRTGTRTLLAVPTIDPAAHDFSLSRDGRFLAALAGESKLFIRDVVSGQNIFEIPTHPHGWYSVRISPDNRTVALSSVSGSLLFWDLLHRGAPTQIPAHQLRIGAMAFSGDGSLLATASSDGTVKIWNALSHQVVSTLESGADAFWSVAFSPDKRRIVAGSGQGTIALWDTSNGELLANLRGHTTGFIGTVAFSPDGQTLVSAAKDAVRFWRATALR